MNKYWRIDHNTKTVVVKLTAPTQHIQDAVISAKNHGYEVLYV